MKILFITDCHCQPKTLTYIQNALSEEVYNIVLGLGDIVERGTGWQSYVEKLLALFQHKNIPFYTIHGNSEPNEAVQYYESQQISIHGRVVNIQGYKIGGLGGFDELPPAPFDVSGGILLTHYPPLKNPKSQISNPKKIQNSNSKNQTFTHSSMADAPLIHACGHFHHISRTWQLGETTVIQVPTTQNGRMTCLSLPSREIEFFTPNQYNK